MEPYAARPKGLKLPEAPRSSPARRTLPRVTIPDVTLIPLSSLSHASMPSAVRSARTFSPPR